VERAAEGREHNQALKAAKDDRFGVVKQTSTGKKQAVNHDVGLMTVSQKAQTSKFKSCFGELKPVEKRPYQSNGTSQKRKPVSYFDTVK
jgi:hypothetical protein